jgi:hypothetical protein
MQIKLQGPVHLDNHGSDNYQKTIRVNMLKHRTEAVIADLVDAAYGGQRGPGGRRKRHVMRQALYALVRLAKVEQLMEMRLDAEQAAGGMASAGQRRQTKALLRKIAMDVHAEGHRLERDWSAARAATRDEACPDIENDCGER